MSNLAMRFVRHILLGACLASAAFGQLSTGSITGVVTDPTGAPIPNVQVWTLQIDTNFQTVVATNNQGLYRVQSLQPGVYHLTFELPGFKKTVRNGLVLRVGDVLSVNVRLRSGK